MYMRSYGVRCFFFFQAEDAIRVYKVTGVQTCALPISRIAMSKPYEVSYWSKKFKVTPARLKSAVAAVGHSSKKVGEYLTGKKAAKKAKKTAKIGRASCRERV